jgi:hypothetical protein
MKDEVVLEMSDFADKVQALIDEVYNEWQKDANKGKHKRDILGGFSEAHQIAVLFGNFNYQVENGGIEQWVYNGYFHDDAEKLIDYLVDASEHDERFKTILDIVYKLDHYAHETECDRDGYYRDPDNEDGGNGFIGDMVGCDAFDTWYYGHCGGDDWWEAVSGIIDKSEARECASAEHEPPAERERLSVMEKIREAKAATRQPHKPKEPGKSHSDEL